jgi:hypothetical protein
MQGLVELTVPGAVEPNPHRLAAGGRDRGGPAQHGEDGVAGAAARMRPGAQHDGGHDWAHASPGEQVGPPDPHERGDGRVCSATLVFRSWMRWARARRLAAVAQVSVSQTACCRSRPQVLTRGVVKPRSRPRRGSGAATTSAWSWRWASVAAWTAERRAASRTDNLRRRTSSGARRSRSTGLTLPRGSAPSPRSTFIALSLAESAGTGFQQFTRERR